MGVDWARRVGTFCVAAPLAIYLLCSATGTAALTMLIQTGCLLEFRLNVCPQILQHMAGRKPAHAPWLHALTLAGLGALVAAAATFDKWTHDATAAGVYFAVFLLHLLMAKGQREPTLHAGLLSLVLDLVALCYIVHGFGHAILVRQASSTYGMGLQIMTVACSWICDTGALVAGSLFGNAKLLAAISPGKTVAGGLGGIVFSVATVVGASLLPPAYACLPPLSLLHQVLLGIAMGIACIAGDLVESYLKRVAQVKDSGVFFPGHGGCLDRMDSLLFVAPLMYYWTTAMGI
ncbi:phosphatidate cytidylyltransferase [Saprolegnia diclina VS20]|uniref:Phosphatidate cytidylyltransferase n=1 Tax=Saprolegnia diclina (strain VS20) TaxID=1156394 RepID=T0Q856_SAPDV|nr:phosphatidate cytidylyltransferase [Saprolegnia diclina VS20]EQC30811.1 phosphatidate cytidylyltransferase [Saprolegnia diclina VS20]|eukprot:XP_008615835.1 phosphatidate cytidylyltransferase [Saprolegnia diclina VS20]